MNPSRNQHTFRHTNKFVLIGYLVTIALMQFGCSPQINDKSSEGVESLNWATADKKAIKNAISQILLQKTPYPDDIYFDPNAMHNKLRALKQKLKTAKDNCEGSRPSANSSLIRDNSKPNTDTYCRTSDLGTSLIKSLNLKIEHQNELITKRKLFDKRIQRQAETEVPLAIRSYAKNRYRLVLDSKPHNILYNQEGVFINITDAVIEDYRKQALN